MSSTAISPLKNVAQSLLGQMARAVLGAEAARQVGAFVLRPAQRAAVRAAERALEEFGGALVADAPGTGKTLLALAIASAYADVLVIAPAALREQWKRAASRSGVSARFESIEGLSQGRIPSAAPLIIVDEAHHLRTPTTQRYRALAQLSMHRRLLLLSATPVVNTRRDRDALLALFLGARAAALEEATLTAVVLRLASDQSFSADVVRLASLESASDLPGLGSALRQLPPPLPLADGAQASAIVRVALAFAWASSLAALDAALRRRLERGRVLADQLAAGRWPSRDALRSWILGDDATQLSLGFETLLAAPVPEGAALTLAAHLHAVEELRALTKPRVEHDTLVRAQSLRSLLAQHVARRVVVLAHSAVTVRALYGALSAEPGVVAISGNRVFAAAGRWTRDEVLGALGPSARRFDPNDPRGIRLLIATDILAEGVELQGASVLVHADPTWTPARLEQRLGRLARDGQRELVVVTQFDVPEEAESQLQMRERLKQKRSASTSALSAAAADAQLRARLAIWAQIGRESGSPASVAAIRASRCGFIALLRSGGEAKMVGGEFRRGRWRMHESSAAILPLLPHETLRVGPLSATHVTCVRRVLRRWQRGRSAAKSVSDANALPESLARALRNQLESIVAKSSLSTREGNARRVSELLLRVSALRGRGAEMRLQQLVRAQLDSETLMAQLHALIHDRSASLHERPLSRLENGRYSIEALLILIAEPASAEISGAALP